MCKFPTWGIYLGKAARVIPRVARSGHSFTGAGLYYLNDKRDAEDRAPSQDPQRAFSDAADYALHDKGSRQTSFRVGFTVILNMDAQSPEQAIDQMTASYDRYREREAHKRGRKLTKPVYVYSLSWAPDQTPDREEMLHAAHSSLKALRLEGLQTLIVQHIDEPHPHIHVLVNRIERDGSCARNIPFDRLRFSRWAEDYEREHGRILCEQRVRNNELRRQGVMVRDNVSLSRSEYTARERAQRGELRRWQQEQDAFRKHAHRSQKVALWEKQLGQRDALAARTKAALGKGRETVKKQLRPKWQQLYKEQRADRERVAKANEGGILERAVYVFTHRQHLADGSKLRIRDIARLCLSPKALNRRLARIHRNARAKLASWEHTLSRGAIRNAWRAHREALGRLKTAQELEREALLSKHQRDWHAVARHRKAEAAKDLEAAPFRAPTLSPGNNMSPGEVRKLTHDSDQTKTSAPESRSARMLREMEEQRRRGRHKGRDFGPER